jgi:protein-S-isoprenylcysteine O-methyltransferase Ste14
MNVVRIAVKYLTAGAACLLGGGALVFFTLFLFYGSFNLVNLGLGQGSALLFDAGLSLLFFLQHSGMVRRQFRRTLVKIMPEEWFAAFYALTSAAALFAVIHFWQEGTLLFAAPPGFIRWALRAIFCLAIVGFLWCGMSLKYFDPFGIGPLLNRHGTKTEHLTLTVQGPYRLVRHPLYFLSIVMIWFCPDLTTDRLLFNLLWTCWIVVGAFLEERDLLEEFGDCYREYRKKVPMLIPFLILRRRKPDLY